MRRLRSLPPLTCVLQVQSELVSITTFDINKAGAEDAIRLLKQTVRNSSIPKVLEKKKNGDYTEPTPELLEFLNFEFSAHPSLLHAVAKLHTGAFIVDKEVMFITVAESYIRSKATDIHSESDQKSVPTVSDSLYGSLCTGVYEESDGGGLKHKLKIGSRTMNILATMSVRVGAEKPVSIGPEVPTTSHFICPKTSRIFYHYSLVP